MTYSSTVLALPGLLWWSRLADTSTPFTDASGGGHNLTWGTGVTGNVSGATIDGDKASGAGTGGSTIATASWMDTTGSWWAAIWVKSSTTGTERTALSRYTNNTNYAFQVGFSTTNKALIRLRNSSATNNSVVGSTTITDGAWHLIVGTWDGSVIKVYVDGVLDGTSSAFTGTLTTGQTFRLNGGAGAMTSGDGMDEAMFGGGSGSTSFLSATDVTNLYTAATSAGGAASGSGSLTLSASGLGRAPLAGAGSLALSASGAVRAPIVATAAITLAASGGGAAPVAGTASLTFAATGSLGGSSSAAGTASLSLSAAGSGAAPITGLAAITLAGAAGGAARIAGLASFALSGTAGALKAAIEGAASIELQALGVVAAPGGGTAYLVLTAEGSAHPPFRDIKVLAIVDVSRLITPVDVSRNPAPLETPRELTITEEVYA